MDICKEKQLCTGCTACANVCPRNCISMIKNDEGFDYPHIDESRCIQCGLCRNTCPVNHEVNKNDIEGAFVARNRRPEIVEKSTSGGMSSSLADYVFSKDGFLYGVGYDEKMRVRHFGIGKNERQRIVEMQGSKYVQSSLDTTFLNIKQRLDDGVFCCFIGTPCQVAGLKAFLRREYENLLTVDLVCHGVASPLFFSKYIEHMEAGYKSRVIDARFRNKTYGYHSGTMMIEFENGKKYYGSGRIDYMLKAYFTGACSRYSCYQCPFKGDKRCSDLTIFDSWNIEKLVPGKKDDDKGYTNIFAHSSKGIEAIYGMHDNLELWEADASLMEKLDGVMIFNNPKMAHCRKILFHSIETDGFISAMMQYLPVTKKDFCLETVKKTVYKLGVMQLIKKYR